MHFDGHNLGTSVDFVLKTVRFTILHKEKKWFAKDLKRQLMENWSNYFLTDFFQHHFTSTYNIVRSLSFSMTAIHSFSKVTINNYHLRWHYGLSKEEQGVLLYLYTFNPVFEQSTSAMTHFMSSWVLEFYYRAYKFS